MKKSLKKERELGDIALANLGIGLSIEASMDTDAAIDWLLDALRRDPKKSTQEIVAMTISLWLTRARVEGFREGQKSAPK